MFVKDPKVAEHEVNDEDLEIEHDFKARKPISKPVGRNPGNPEIQRFHTFSWN